MAGHFFDRRDFSGFYFILNRNSHRFGFSLSSGGSQEFRISLGKVTVDLLISEENDETYGLKFGDFNGGDFKLWDFSDWV